MDRFRHAPLTFWVSLSVALGVLAVAALTITPAQLPDSRERASVSQQRHELLELRTHLALLVTLARNPDRTLADEADDLAVRAHEAATRAAPALSAGYSELGSGLEELAEYVRAHYPDDVVRGTGQNAVAASVDGTVSLSQLPLPDPADIGRSDLGTVEPPNVAAGVEADTAVRDEIGRRVARILADADRLTAAAWS
jgi:hypothetical protein